jgi:hypothetical protein
MPQFTTMYIRKGERDDAKRVQRKHRLRHASDVLRGLLRCYDMLDPQQQHVAMYPIAESQQRQSRRAVPA